LNLQILLQQSRHVSVINWVKKYGKALTHPSEQGKKLSAVELDKLCSYVGSKKKDMDLASCG
jgi:hypothetical protein